MSRPDAPIVAAPTEERPPLQVLLDMENDVLTAAELSLAAFKLTANEADDPRDHLAMHRVVYVSMQAAERVVEGWKLAVTAAGGRA